MITERTTALIEEICEVTGLEAEMFNVNLGIDWEGFINRARSLARSQVRSAIGPDRHENPTDLDDSALIREAEIWLTAARLAWRVRLRIVYGREPALLMADPDQLKILADDLAAFGKQKIDDILMQKPSGIINLPFTESDPYFFPDDEY